MSEHLKRAIIVLAGLLGLALAQEPAGRSLRAGLAESKALLEMSAPNPVSISGFKESYSYRLTLSDVFFDTKGSTTFGLVLASRAGGAADTVSFTFAGPYSALQPAIANAFHLLMWGGICLGVPKEIMPTLNQGPEFFGQLVQALQQRSSAGFSKVYNGVSYSFGNLEFAGTTARFTVTLQNPGRPGLGGWKEACSTNDPLR
ncbi:MAG: hypothetical protein SFU83_16610 [Meiothermus sp.]|nr:hypothetical protein [Meiothermus sp.]